MRRLVALGFFGSLVLPFVVQAGSLNSNFALIWQDSVPAPARDDKDSQETQTAEPAQNQTVVLRTFHSYSICSKTVFMHPDAFQQALNSRPEFKEWNLVPGSCGEKADVTIEISLPPLSWEWNYRLLESASGNLLATGKVHALEEHQASKLLAAEIAEKIAAVKGMPEGNLNQVQLPTSATTHANQWRVKGASGSFRDQEVSVSIGADQIVVTEISNKEHSLIIPTRNITAVYRINLRPPELLDRMQAGASEECCESGPLADLKAHGIDLVQAGEMLVAPFLAVPLLGVVGIDEIRVGMSTRHLAAVRWERESSPYELAFESGVVVLNDLLRNIKSVAPPETESSTKDYMPFWPDTSSPAIDLTKKKPLLEISIDEAVIVAPLQWPPLEPGVYQLEIFDPDNPPAQIQFYHRETGQFLVLRAVGFAQVQRGLPLVTTPIVTYRGKEGIRMLHEVRAADILLHFD